MATNLIDGVRRVSNMAGRIVSAVETMTLEDQDAGLAAGVATYNAIHGTDFRLGKVHDAVDESGFTFAGGDAMSEILERVETGKSAGLAFAYFDRNGRNWWRQGPFFERLQAGAGLYVVRGYEAIDYRTPEGRQMFGLMSVASESSYWSAKTRSDNVVAGIMARKVPNRLAYGYNRNGTYVNGKLESLEDPTRDPKAGVKDPVKIAVVRRIFDLRLTKHSTLAIAAILNADGIPSPRGGEWVHSTVDAIVANEQYKGVIVFGKLSGKKRNRVRVPESQWRRASDPAMAVVTATEWRNAQLTDTVKRTGAYKAGVAGGIVTCHACGNPLRVLGTGPKGSGRFNYGCRRHSSAGGKCPAPTNIRKDVADEFVDRIVAGALEAGTIDTVAASRRVDETAAAHAAAVAEREAFGRKVKPTHEMFEAWLADYDAAVEATRHAHEDASAAAGVAASLPAPHEYLALPVPSRNRVARALLAGVVVNPPTVAARKATLADIEARMTPVWR